MRPGNNTRRPRGRPNRKQHVSSRTQAFDSHGPEVRIRGNAPQVYEKYLTLARDATSSGDRVAAESYYQFAEHYFRIMNDSTDPQRHPQPTQAQQEPPRNAQDHPRAPQEQRNVARDKPEINEEQPDVEWPARSDDVNGSAAEQPQVAEEAGPEEKSTARPAPKPRTRSRRRAANGAEKEPADKRTKEPDAEKPEAGDDASPAKAAASDEEKTTPVD